MIVGMTVWVEVVCGQMGFLCDTSRRKKRAGPSEIKEETWFTGK